MVRRNEVPKNAMMSTFGNQTKREISIEKTIDADIEASLGRQ